MVEAVEAVAAPVVAAAVEAVAAAVVGAVAAPVAVVEGAEAGWGRWRRRGGGGAVVEAEALLARAIPLATGCPRRPRPGVAWPAQACGRRADIFAVDIPCRSATAGPAKKTNTMATARNWAILWRVRLLATDEAGKDNGECGRQRHRTCRKSALFAGDSGLAATSTKRRPTIREENGLLLRLALIEGQAIPAAGPPGPPLRVEVGQVLAARIARPSRRAH